MPYELLPWARLMAALDALDLLGWLTLIAVTLAALETAWKALTRPVPIRGTTLTWVPVPADLPVSARPSYGHRDLRAIYPRALTRGVIHGALGLVLAMSLWSWWLEAAKAPPTNDGCIHPVTIPIAPEWLTLVTLAPELTSTGAAPLPTELARILGQKIVPSAEAQALNDSTRLREQEALFRSSLFVEAGGSGDGLSPVSTGLETRIPEGMVMVEEPTLSLDMVEELPVLITLPAPDYPQLARDAGIEGVVELNLLITPKGTVETARILRSIPGLDEAAAAAALGARFRPARWQGRPVRVWATLKVRFQLNGE